MKFTCDRDEFLTLVADAEPITGTKTNFSILSNVLLETDGDGGLTIMADNMETTLIGKIKAKVVQAGAVTIIQTKLLNILKQFPAGDVLVEMVAGEKVKIKSLDKKRNARAAIKGTSRSNFPEIRNYDEKNQVATIDKLYFRRMIQKTIFAVSNDNSQYTLNGVLFEMKDSFMKMIAIDGRRLALINTTFANEDKKELSVIIPQQTLSMLFKIINTEGPLSIAFQDKRIFFKFDKILLSSNLLEGKFPNYNMFIPARHENFFTANTDDIKKAISLASVLADPETYKMNWFVDENTLKVSAQNSEYGESDEDVFIQYSGKPVKLGLNFKLLGEILKEVETDDVEYHFNAALSPVMIREKNRNEYFYIIMPMKTD